MTRRERASGGGIKRYIAIPHKNDLGLGRNLALRFTERELPWCAENSIEILETGS